MTTLLWPGDERAGDLFADPAVLRAQVEVEAAWLAALVESGIAPGAAADDLTDLVGAVDVAEVAAGGEAGGNPVLALLAVLRARLGGRNAEAARWLHRGLTSQDVLDTALMLCAGNVRQRLGQEFAVQVAALAGLAEQHRAAVMAARSLTQHAVPTTFGVKVAGWLDGVVDAAEEVTALEFPASFSGAAGTLAAPAEVAVQSGVSNGPKAAVDLADRAASRLGLPVAAPWHTNRSAVTRLGDALTRCTDAWGRIANDVLTMSRPEIGELREPVAEGRGASSTMPHKINPVLSVLLRRAALAAPTLAASLHVAAADMGDERPPGAWHLEWSTLQLLARRTLVAASQASELLSGIQIDAGRMLATARGAADDLLAEQRAVATAAGRPLPAPDLSHYLGAANEIIDAALGRAARFGSAS